MLGENFNTFGEKDRNLFSKGNSEKRYQSSIVQPSEKDSCKLETSEENVSLEMKEFKIQ
jgi:hypothetical protein